MRAAVDYLTSLFFKLERAACVRVLCFSPFAGGGERERERERGNGEREREGTEREKRETKERRVACRGGEKEREGVPA